MNGITWIHVAAGIVALATGAIAVAVRKGGRTHVSAGTWFCVSMIVLGLTASILSPFKTPPDSPVGGLMVCYFVATAWAAARRRDGVPGAFEKVACAVILAMAVAIIGKGIQTALSAFPPMEPPGPGALFAVGAVCLLAGLGDLRFVVRGSASATQRLSRHLWRMCFALFIATGSFFLGQQDVLPQAVRGSPMLFVVAFAPIALMLFWLVQVRRPRALPPASAASTRTAAGTAPASG